MYAKLLEIIAPFDSYPKNGRSPKTWQYSAHAAAVFTHTFRRARSPEFCEARDKIIFNSPSFASNTNGIFRVSETWLHIAPAYRGSLFVRPILSTPRVFRPFCQQLSRLCTRHRLVGDFTTTFLKTPIGPAAFGGLSRVLSRSKFTVVKLYL